MIDISVGVACYALTALVFGRGFYPLDLGLGVFFALAPDFDFVPFALLRKRLGLVSHWLIHFPLVYVPVGGILVVAAGGRGFHITLFVLASIGHFIHDSASVPGIQWFWPVSKTAYALKGFRFVRVDPEERRRFYERVAEGAPQRSIFDEIKMRVGKGRPKWFSRR